MRNLLLASLTLLLFPGCHSYLRPMDDTPIPIHTPLATKGGGVIKVDPSGRLILRPAANDFESSWGVTLEDSDRGVRVVARVSATSALEDGDVIRAVKSGWVVSKATEFYADDTPLSKEKLLERGVTVESTADLEGYALGWNRMSVLVEREGKELTVLQEVGRPIVLPLHPFAPEHTNSRGLQLLRIDSWPEDWRPVLSEPTDLLVSHVGRESLMGIEGFRPLDLIRPFEDKIPDDSVAERLDGLSFNDLAKANVASDLLGLMVIRPGQTFPMVKRMPSWSRSLDGEIPFVPGLFSYEDDKVRSHLGLGPLDLLFHYHDAKIYNPLTDAYAIESRVSIFNVFQWGFLSGDGQNDELEFAFNPIADTSKSWYYMKRIGEDD